MNNDVNSRVQGEAAQNPLRRLGTGHRVDTSESITFTFDGKTYTGCAGDTLASALLANGVRRVGRSFKLHRPRGLLSAGREEPNALVQLEGEGFGEPNARATLVPLYKGLKARGQNAWPSVERDMLGVLGLFQRLFPASFYYKSLMWPSWHFYEGLVRRLAGLGKVPRAADAQQYHKRNLHCEVLIVGGGAAGLAAALAAGAGGLRVVLMDDQEELGGSLLGENRVIGGSSSTAWIAQAVAKLRAQEGVTLLPRTSVIGYYEHNFLVGVERVCNHLGPGADLQQPRERLWRVRAKQVVLATGAIERPLVFADNDRPGIMLASAVQTYLNRYGVAAGRRVVLVTNNDSVYRVALDLHDLGVTVVAVVDSRRDPVGPYQQAVRDRQIPLLTGRMVRQVRGRRQVRAVRLAAHLGGGQLGESRESLACDVVAMSGGWTPSIHLYSQAGGSLDFNEHSACFVPASCAQAVRVAGAANGEFQLQGCLAEGYRSGAAAARAAGAGANVEPSAPSCDDWPQTPLEPYWYTGNAATEKQWLDFQYDVKVSDIELARRENFISVEHVKRYTTNGMSVDQGKTSNVNALAVMAALSGRKIPAVGTTRFRPPYHPATIGTFVGRDLGESYAPRLELPAHSWHLAQGAWMEDMGWQRPQCYLRAGEDFEAAVRREAVAVRRSVGMFDGSPLGKIEVKGPDAARFLNRIYINNAVSLKVNAGRYGLMCNENGVVIDDGVFVRLADDHFMVHTTSGGATRIHRWLEEWLQCEWLDLQVLVNNVTTQWANVTVSGPNARQVLQALDSDIDFDAAAFPHMQFRSGTVNGVEARILRASFTGEASYEISVPARYGLALWEAVYAAGETFDITPYGVESLMVLRTEKGYLHVGADTDGTTNPLDLGWGVPIGKKQDDFIGRRSLARANDTRKDRLQFVGIEAVDPRLPLPVGGHVVSCASPAVPAPTQGYLTSACLSPALEKSIGLGLVSRGRERLGEQVYIYADGNTTAAKIVSPTHFDAKGERLNG
ncbi:sarcosine oxidase subunit alpha family protein [Exilibacterium tricleocarpae]|uniref:Sarcosine oxidase subunit alpha family protein n=1 Tax=Exilibacterium tricleocarpae TaxID=2591008 RepID=A0A545SZW8_9GAMM|nr:sarcosine oxidase subunit alpha family protein [Exilibacterium tricleocarpae]TQV70515.1 sarcosine oxidase subunit alpha family protein [Exilibacterium tricleocarpae]